MDASTFRFPKASRLVRQSDFQAIKLKGRRIVMGCLILNWNQRNQQGSNPCTDGERKGKPSVLRASGPRLGIITSKRVGSAVVRNRVRRYIREVFRQNRHHWDQATDMVVIARASAAKADLSGIERDFLQAIRRAGLRAGH